MNRNTTMQIRDSAHTANFKAEVALAALRNAKTINELAFDFNVMPEQIELWKFQFLNNINKVFEQESDSAGNNPFGQHANRHVKIGQLTAENEFLFKVLGRKAN